MEHETRWANVAPADNQAWPSSSYKCCALSLRTEVEFLLPMRAHEHLKSQLEQVGFTLHEPTSPPGQQTRPAQQSYDATMARMLLVRAVSYSSSDGLSNPRRLASPVRSKSNCAVAYSVEASDIHQLQREDKPTNG